MTLPDPAADPAGYVLAVANLREQRAKAATGGAWFWANAEHIAAEANPVHALAEVALWRGIARRHVPDEDQYCHQCTDSQREWAIYWPCPDLLAVVEAAKAYAGGAS